MGYNSYEIKEGIKLHIINTNKFKTNLLTVFISTELDKNNVTPNALIPLVLKRGTNNLKTQEDISKELENMYGASFDCGIDKTGDNQIIKFYIESVNNQYLPNNEDLLSKSIEKLLEIVFNPLIENESFKETYVESEKQNLKKIIEGKKDNKARYAQERCIEEMYKDMPYGLYKFGKIEELEKIDNKSLYNRYLQLIENCKIDIFVSGEVDENIIETFRENENIKKLKPRTPKYKINTIETEKKNEKMQEKEIKELADVEQAKIVIGLDIFQNNIQDKYTALVYNAILGGTPISKMFQNVREKESLAYSIGSGYIRQKANIIIKGGIDKQNYEKALKIIKEQIEDMKKGEFTEEDIKNAKAYIISTIKFIPDEQDTEITYYFGQEISGYKMKLKEYIEKIEKITKNQITELAQRIKINTIYLLSK